MFRVFAIHSECARLHNLFFFMMDYGENGYLVIIGGGGWVGIKMSWVEKNPKINNRGEGDDYSGLESNEILNSKLKICKNVFPV